MATEVWLAITSSLLAICGSLAAAGFRDVSRRLQRLERQDAKLFAALLTLLGTKSDDHTAIANAMHELLSVGLAPD